MRWQRPATVKRFPRQFPAGNGYVLCECAMLCRAISAPRSESDTAGFELPIPCGASKPTDCYSVESNLRRSVSHKRRHSSTISSTMRLFSGEFSGNSLGRTRLILLQIPVLTFRPKCFEPRKTHLGQRRKRALSKRRKVKSRPAAKSPLAMLRLRDSTTIAWDFRP
jgi:hypothetical protein